MWQADPLNWTFTFTEKGLSAAYDQALERYSTCIAKIQLHCHVSFILQLNYISQVVRIKLVDWFGIKHYIILGLWEHMLIGALTLHPKGIGTVGTYDMINCGQLTYSEAHQGIWPQVPSIEGRCPTPVPACSQELSYF